MENLKNDGKPSSRYSFLANDWTLQGDTGGHLQTLDSGPT